jgi:hypothetical protein
MRAREGQGERAAAQACAVNTHFAATSSDLMAVTFPKKQSNVFCHVLIISIASCRGWRLRPE